MHILTADKAGNKTETVKGPITVTKVMAKVGEKVTGENKEYEKNGNTAIIPVGFAIKPGCDDISQGLVISDVANDTNDTGNQFVWIPIASNVDYREKLNIYPAYYTDVSHVGSYCSTHGLSPFLPSGVTDEKATVVSAGGFYVARYETGGGLVSKKGVMPWTNISQAAAKSQAKNFINNKYVKSAITSDAQCDLVMDFVNGKKDGTGQYFYANSPSTTRHLGNQQVRATGGNRADLVCNIYDLEGNVNEYSTGVGHQSRTSTDWGYQRGGDMDWKGDWRDRASVRLAVNDGLNNWSTGFRMVLYVMK